MEEDGSKKLSRERRLGWLGRAELEGWVVGRAAGPKTNCGRLVEVEISALLEVLSEVEGSGREEGSDGLTAGARNVEGPTGCAEREKLKEAAASL